MKKTLKIWCALILFLFLFPVFINYLPDGGTTKSLKLIREPGEIVFAANVTEEQTPELVGGKALLYFTHSQEAYEQVTKAKNGKVAVSHQTENIMKFGEKLKNQLDVNGFETDILPVQVPHKNAYKAIRPHVEKRIKEVNYDLIIDLHRDSIGPDKTTIVHNSERYAKVAFVIGMEHPNFASNEAMANQLKGEMEQIVPGITRNLVKKSGHNVDGKYNQDLNPAIVLVELGGVGNSEEELNRTIAVIAKAASSVISDGSNVKY
ncbi:stage II sporulation protein P [Sporosarcina sp. G11-34]|uniref:stage II sporulation protein P n=1 Tax=Sporosarcina sp. G11-34 TaxID=2849605 RepID=UPI0022A98A3E|nr:stage II sporulation protein P [Sporosarcina sp. G11-34]MCZ2259376.1 stage II sporulation protein P [Sporosarcina sp. G11-34]